MIRKSIAFFVLCIASAQMLFAQALPNTKIYYFPLNFAPNLSIFVLSEPWNLTSYHGYNNQPCFHANGSQIDYVSIREDKQADIYRYDFKAQQTQQITHTSTYKEYSPRWASDEKTFTVVRVEPDDSTQYLWRYNADGTPLKQLSKINPVGYYTPFNQSNFALFVLNKKGGDLYILNEKGQTFKVDENIGRCLLPIHNNEKDTAFYYVSKRPYADSNYHIMSCNAKGRIRQVGIFPKGTEDFCIGPNGTLCFGYEHKLYALPVGDGKIHSLTEAYYIADFSTKPWANFYRLNYVEEKTGSGYLAVVVYEGEKP
jgi:hypothetical protein